MQRPHWHLYCPRAVAGLALALLAAACGQAVNPGPERSKSDDAQTDDTVTNEGDGGAGVSDDTASSNGDESETEVGGSAGPMPPSRDEDVIDFVETPAPVSSMSDAGTCAAETHSASLLPLAIYVVLDQSNSMVWDEDRWTPVTNAIMSLAQSDEFAGVSLALDYFPMVTEDEVLKCSAASYEDPAVPFDVLPAHVDDLQDSLESHSFDMATAQGPDEPLRARTPTGPALLGAFSYLREWQDGNPGNRLVVVLATDGDPVGCPERNTVNDVVDILGAEAQADEPFRTYVVGIGEFDALGRMAEAGGTGFPPFGIDGSGTTTEDEFLEALREVRQVELPCSFELPSAAAEAVDQDAINVDVVLSPGDEPVPLFQVDDESDCNDATDAWFYPDSSQASIELCSATCESVRDTPEAELSIALGCATRTWQVR